MNFQIMQACTKNCPHLNGSKGQYRIPIRRQVIWWSLSLTPYSLARDDPKWSNYLFYNPLINTILCAISSKFLLKSFHLVLLLLLR